ncbi:MAG TPA: nucleotidyltransferase domain-containing protein [Terriglobia bacterium]|nr:nucleotidyltransferase domain-containing protein [Terriglobia bacterium]
MTISCGREADFESAEVIACAFNQNFDNKVSWVKSERDPRGRIAATCRVEGVADFSLQLSWRGTVITQANLLPGEHWPSMHKADQQIAIWASSRIQPILDTLKTKLQELYGDRFRGLYVFGSYASPDAGVDLGIDSDLDIALLLSDFDNRYDERARVSDIVASLSLEHDIVISLIPIRERDFKEGSTNFTRVISEYAIPVE